MVTHKGEIDTYGRPVGQELGIAVATESAYIRTVEGLAAESKGNGHGDAGLELLPAGEVVARPGGRIAVSAQEVAAAENERTLVGVGQQETLATGTHHIQAIYVVVAQVGVGTESVTAQMPVGHRHGTRRTAKDTGLVHIIPDTVHTLSHEGGIEGAPPGADLGTGESGKWQAPGHTLPTKGFPS